MSILRLGVSFLNGPEKGVKMKTNDILCRIQVFVLIGESNRRLLSLMKLMCLESARFNWHAAKVGELKFSGFKNYSTGRCPNEEERVIRL